MNAREVTVKASGTVWSLGVTGSDASSSELVFVLETPQGRMDFKTDDTADPRSFAAMAAILTAAYTREEAVSITYFEDTRIVSFVGVPALHW
jgi:hypothetical protein